MTKATLTELLQAHTRLWWWIVGTAGRAYFVLFFAIPEIVLHFIGWPLARPLEREERRAAGLALAIVFCSTSLATTLVLILLMRWCSRWSARKFGLLCPSCGAALCGRYRYAALGAGKCGSCQTQIVGDAPASLIGVVLPTRAELLTKLGEYMTAHARQANLWILAIWLCFLTSGLVIWPFQVYVEPSLRSAGLLLLGLPYLMVALTFPLFVYLHYLMRWHKRMGERHGLTCPWCEAALTGANGKTASATGRCSACGQPVCADALA
jgi:hypothetical protein